MKIKILLSSFLIFGFSWLANAIDRDFRVPMSVNRSLDEQAKYAGVQVSTRVEHTTAGLVTDQEGVTITAGLVYWVVRPSTAADGTYLEMRDTGTANLTGNRLIPWIPAQSTGTATNVRSLGDQVIRFDPPIPFYSGLSLNIIGTQINGLEYAVGVRVRE